MRWKRRIEAPRRMITWQVTQASLVHMRWEKIVRRRRMRKWTETRVVRRIADQMWQKSVLTIRRRMFLL